MDDIEKSAQKIVHMLQRHTGGYRLDVSKHNPIKLISMLKRAEAIAQKAGSHIVNRPYDKYIELILKDVPKG